MQIAKRLCVILMIITLLPVGGGATVYKAHPKLVVIIVIDQFRGDYLERHRDQFVLNGLRLLMDHGAYFTDCYYDYVNLHTAPGHATLGTGAYSNGHGIAGNEWYDPSRDAIVSSVEDSNTTTIGAGSGAVGASPHNLQAGTLGDELRLATQGRSRVFGVSLKDRAAILTTGFSANAAYWIDRNTGGFQTSSYYMKELPPWAADFNAQKRTDKYWDKQWKDDTGNVLGTTDRPKEGGHESFYEVVGGTPFAIDYELEFARELVTNEKLGQGETTDLLVVSLSAFDILGHQVGPDSTELAAMTLAVDKQLAEFFAFLGRQVGLANVWIALSADHGIGYMPDSVAKLHIPGQRLNGAALRKPLNEAIVKRFPDQPASDFVKQVVFPYIYLSQKNFETVGIKDEEKAEQMIGEALKSFSGVRGFYTRAQIAKGDVPADEMGRKTLHSYSPITTWYVQVKLSPFLTDYPKEVAHMMPYSYDTHVPLLFYGLAFAPGIYRTHAEPVDLAVTLASLLGVNKPTHAVGRVLTEALAAQPKAVSDTVKDKKE